MPQAQYTRLSDSEEDKPLFEGEEPKAESRSAGLLNHRRWERRLWFLLSGSLLLNIVLVGLYLLRPTVKGAPLLYSPAQSAVEYKLVRFSKGFNLDRPEPMPIYEQEPSDEGDVAWKALWFPNDLRLSKDEARKMHNGTTPLENDREHYMISLEVFHQLHCLDMIRQQLYPERNYTQLPMDHIRHCFGAVRQALMCHGDVTPVVFQWSTHFQQVVQRDDILHECRDFDKIRQWANEHQQLPGPSPDLTIFVEPDLGSDAVFEDPALDKEQE
ncbi:hypothetical protein HMN09_01272100 [Mycena chlorophos]|uniref:Tat pathway signal sequence n=1 Tax=Mycena chlorophos TaxID=658473 RepID=A0A8H6S427_MYCCL|nr:hypothetical protein HMN09_01272100 [Mycena chlorophos]